MSITEAMKARHSVRAYLDRPLEEETVEALTAYIDACNQESGLHMQLVTQEPRAFDSRLAHYGHFQDVHNYIALIGSRGRKLDETVGYYGEKVVLHAQEMGLNTCWVALTYKRILEAFSIDRGERLVMIIAIGYGANEGVPHKSKDVHLIAPEYDATPRWFQQGSEAALLAPTAMNQQKFRFGMQGARVFARAGVGPYAKVDLGIAKLHFEIGSEKDSSIWA